MLVAVVAIVASNAVLHSMVAWIVVIAMTD